MAAYDQPTNEPTTKMKAVGAYGALSIILIYVLNQAFGINIPADVASALTLVLSFIGGYLTREQQ